HCCPGGALQDLGEATGARKQDAEADQNPRPAGKAHPNGRKRKNRTQGKQPPKLERGLEIELQSGRSRHERPSSPFRDQTRLKISVPLVPPNPKEFDRAERSGMRRATLGT